MSNEDNIIQTVESKCKELNHVNTYIDADSEQKVIEFGGETTSVHQLTIAFKDTCEELGVTPNIEKIDEPNMVVEARYDL